jgi:hypothetical protein
MKKTTLALAFFLTVIVQSIGQTNPVINVTWDHEYIMPHNYFELRWDEPSLPHDELIGYNIYRENELYRFQTENSLFNLQLGSNCDEDFLAYGDQNGFLAHVTAVYNPGQIESPYLQTVFVDGLALKNNEFVDRKAMLYPNPTSGILNIGTQNLCEIVIYDISGKKIKEFAPQPQIELYDIAKGIYLIKLISEKQIITDKIVVE